VLMILKMKLKGDTTMALFYLTRHGEPDYDSVAQRGFYGFGCSFAPIIGKWN